MYYFFGYGSSVYDVTPPSPLQGIVYVLFSRIGLVEVYFTPPNRKVTRHVVIFVIFLLSTCWGIIYPPPPPSPEVVRCACIISPLRRARWCVNEAGRGYLE